MKDKVKIAAENVEKSVRLDVEEVLKATSFISDIPVEALASKSRERELSDARSAYYICCKKALKEDMNCSKAAMLINRKRSNYYTHIKKAHIKEVRELVEKIIKNLT